MWPWMRVRGRKGSCRCAYSSISSWHTIWPSHCVRVHHMDPSHRGSGGRQHCMWWRRVVVIRLLMLWGRHRHIPLVLWRDSCSTVVMVRIPSRIIVGMIVIRRLVVRVPLRLLPTHHIRSPSSSYHVRRERPCSSKTAGWVGIGGIWTGLREALKRLYHRTRSRYL